MKQMRGYTDFMSLVMREFTMDISRRQGPMSWPESGYVSETTRFSGKNGEEVINRNPGSLIDSQWLV
jgi:hypothetical protein